LVHHLFKGYESTKCDEFVQFMQRKKDDFRDGTLDFTPESLMLVAENKFADLSVDKKWTAVSAQDQVILALRAQIAEKFGKRKPGAGTPAYRRRASAPPRGTLYWEIGLEGRRTKDGVAWIENGWKDGLQLVPPSWFLDGSYALGVHARDQSARSASSARGDHRNATPSHDFRGSSRSHCRRRSRSIHRRRMISALENGVFNVFKTVVPQ
jgi:hypothetical protein